MSEALAIIMDDQNDPPSPKPNYLFSNPAALLFPGNYKYIPPSIKSISLLFTYYEFLPHLAGFRLDYIPYHMLLILM